MHLVVRRSLDPPPGGSEVEVVERKGLGHPDTICDGVAERVSRDLCRHYIERFGEILHHNVDKVLLVGGGSRPKFGGGTVTDPMELIIAGRATTRVGSDAVPVEQIAQHGCREWLSEHLAALDVDRYVRISPRLRPGSGELTALFGRGGQRRLANDTSCGAGFAPLSALERVVLAVERELNAAETKRAHPALGEDVKVMATRVGDRATLTIGCAIIDRHVKTLADYETQKAIVRDLAERAARSVAPLSIDVQVNGADDAERGEIFLTVTGTSAEAGDDGEVGRGNRANGLITPYRPMTLEAAAGKNPTSHVGKLYNVAATRIAQALVAEIDEITDASCVLVSRIGSPVDDPQLADVCLTLAQGSEKPLERRIRDVVADGLSRLDRIAEELVDGTLLVY